MATAADIEAAITSASAFAGLGPDGPKWMKAIRAAESGGSTDTSIPTGDGSSSAKGLWQFTDGTWASVTKQIPASYGVPLTFSTNIQHQALIMAWSLQAMQTQGYTCDPRLIYLYHFSPEVAGKTLKKLGGRGKAGLSSSADFMKAFSDSRDEAVTTGHLGNAYRKYLGMSNPEQMKIRVDRGYIGGIQRFAKACGGLDIPQSTAYSKSKLTEGLGGGKTYNASPSGSMSQYGAGQGPDILITQAIELSSGPSADKVSPSITISDGLSAPSWEQRGEGVAKQTALVGNPKLVALPARGVFGVWLDEAMTNPLTTTGDPDTGEKVEVRLNVSLKSLSVRSRHVIHKKPTRTGFHLTFWGMEPDIITGTGTTGLFLNEFGPASVMSLVDGGDLVAKVQAQYASTSKKLDINIRAGGVTRHDDEVSDAKLLTSDTKQTSRRAYSDLIVGAFSDFLGLNAGGGASGVDRNAIYSSDVAAWSDRKSRYGSGSLLGSFFPSMASSAQSTFRALYTVDKRLKGLLGDGDHADAFRVPAQDAFNELLQLFKNNGQIRFHAEDYDGTFTEKSQVGPQEWDDKTGMTAFMGNARNNDVFTRGYLTFRLKGTTYIGFFKTFAFTMSADTPFTWEFNFTFHVVRTIKSVYIPSLMFKGENNG